jgi:hypothetical protein
VALPLLYENSMTPVRGYMLLNAIRCYPAVTDDRNDADIMIGALAFDANQIPPSVHMFRVAQSPTVTIVSDAIVKEVWGKHMRGITFLRTKVC